MEESTILYILIGALVVALYTEWVRPAVSFLILSVMLIVTDILPAHDVLVGFANEQLAIIIMLLIISNMISQSGIIDKVFGFLTSKSISSRKFMFRMVSGVGISSAFFNNTPLVAIFMPYVHRWCSINKKSPSKFLIPLSFASILGGCATLIGTSTNLIANGLAMDMGFKSLGIFDFALVGGIMLVVGIVYLITIGQRLLPDKSSIHNEAAIDTRHYFLEAHVKASSSLIDQSVESAGLRNLEGLFLVEILREDNIISPVSPKDILQKDDVLFFAGDVRAIQDLTKPELGLSLPKACLLPKDQQENLVEVVVAHNSRLIGQKIQDSDFRGRYDSGIIAVHRNGERLTGKIGEIELKPGDLLLILAGDDFHSRISNNPGFYILSTTENEKKQIAQWKPMVMSIGLILAIVLSFFDVSLFKSLAALLGLGVLINISSPNEIRSSVDFNLLLIIGFGLGLGRAMIKTGAAEEITTAIGLQSLSDPILILALLFIITNVLASFITSKAAVAITVPIAVQVFSQIDIPIQPLILAVAFGGAANFLTPIGYQTNLMVYGPGRYQFTDFFKIGLPLTLVYCLVSSVLLTLSYDLI